MYTNDEEITLHAIDKKTVDNYSLNELKPSKWCFCYTEWGSFNIINVDWGNIYFNDNSTTKNMY